MKKDRTSWAKASRWIRSIGAGLAAGSALLAAGCGDDARSGAGCTTDAECKGVRLCIESQCVDPGASSGGGPSSDAGDGSGEDGGASGGGGSGGNGASGSGAATVVDDPELEAACGEDCKAKLAAACSMNIGSLDQCLAQCLIIDEQSPFCLEEQTARYACLAAGGYTCTNGYPQPKSTCIGELQALSECTLKAPCRSYCERAAGDCAPSGDACITACEAEQASFEDALCGVYYSQLLSCWGRDLVCTDGKRVSTLCEPSFAQVADCLTRRNDECDGFCWAADELGCGSADCVSECKLKLDHSSCGSYYRNVLDCAFGSHALELSCVEGAPRVGAECDNAMQQYTTCVQGQ